MTLMTVAPQPTGRHRLHAARMAHAGFSHRPRTPDAEILTELLRQVYEAAPGSDHADACNRYRSAVEVALWPSLARHALQVPGHLFRWVSGR